MHMNMSAHHPEAKDVFTLDGGTHVVRLGETGSSVDLFIDADWSDWDGIVSKVDEYRSGTTKSDKIAIDLSEWTRLPEVRDYAARRGVTVDCAIRLLVNHGLSHA